MKKQIIKIISIILIISFSVNQISYAGGDFSHLRPVATATDPGPRHKGSPGSLRGGNKGFNNPKEAPQEGAQPRKSRQGREELYPGEAVDKRYFEYLYETIIELDCLRQERIHAKGLAKVDELKAIRRKIRQLSRRAQREVDSFARSIPGLTYRIEAKRALAKAASLILAENEPAAVTALIAAKDRITKERAILLKKRLRFPPKKERVREDEDENIIIYMQRFVSRAGTSILDYKERSFALFTTAFRSLDHAIDSEVEEHNKMKEFFSLLEKDRINIRLLQRETGEGRINRSQIIQEIIGHIDSMAEEFKGVKCPEKNMARENLFKAKRYLAKSRLESAQRCLKEAGSLLRDRLAQTGYIIDSLQQTYVEGLRDILRKRNRSVLSQIDTILGLLKESQYGDIKEDWLPKLLDMKYVKLEPGLKQLRYYLKKALEVVEQILQESDKSEVERLKKVAEAHLKKARARMNEVRVIATVVAEYRDLLKTSRLKKIKGLDAPDDVFERAHKRNLKYLGFMRGTAVLKKLKLYQAARIPPRITGSVTRKRIDNPVYLAISDLIEEVDAEDFEGKTIEEAEAFIETLCEEYQITLDKLVSEAKISFADIGRMLTLGDEIYDRAEEVLISLQAAINKLKNRGYKAALGILKAKRNKVARDLRAVGLKQDGRRVAGVIAMLEQIAELAKKEKDLRQEIEERRSQLDPDRQQLARLERKERSLKKKLFNNPLYHKAQIRKALDSSKTKLTNLRKHPKVIKRPNIVKELDSVIDILNSRGILRSVDKIEKAIRELKRILGQVFPKRPPQDWVKYAGGQIYPTIKILESALPSVKRRNQIIKEKGLDKRERTDPIFAEYKRDYEGLSNELSKLQDEIRQAKQMIKKRKTRLGKAEPELEALKTQMRSLFEQARAALAIVEENLRTRFKIRQPRKDTDTYLFSHTPVSLLILLVKSLVSAAFSIVKAIFRRLFINYDNSDSVMLFCGIGPIPPIPGLGKDNAPQISPSYEILFTFFNRLEALRIRNDDASLRQIKTIAENNTYEFAYWVYTAFFAGTASAEENYKALSSKWRKTIETLTVYAIGQMAVQPVRQPLPKHPTRDVIGRQLKTLLRVRQEGKKEKKEDTGKRSEEMQEGRQLPPLEEDVIIFEIDDGFIRTWHGPDGMCVLKIKEQNGETTTKKAHPDPRIASYTAESRLGSLFNERGMMEVEAFIIMALALISILINPWFFIPTGIFTAIYIYKYRRELSLQVHILSKGPRVRAIRTEVERDEDNIWIIPEPGFNDFNTEQYARRMQNLDVGKGLKVCGTKLPLRILSPMSAEIIGLKLVTDSETVKRILVEREGVVDLNTVIEYVKIKELNLSLLEKILRLDKVIWRVRFFFQKEEAEDPDLEQRDRKDRETIRKQTIAILMDKDLPHGVRIEAGKVLEEILKNTRFPDEAQQFLATVKDICSQFLQSETSVEENATPHSNGANPTLRELLGEIDRKTDKAAMPTGEEPEDLTSRIPGVVAPVDFIGSEESEDLINQAA